LPIKLRGDIAKGEIFGIVIGEELKMNKIPFFLVVVILVTGCVPVLLGAGVATGYAISSDAAIGNVQSDYRTLWDQCLSKLTILEAEILTSDQSRGLIQGKIGEYNISVKIKNINDQTQRLKVSARKYLMPKPQYAQKIFFNIIEDI
jgi:hypothetical protein